MSDVFRPTDIKEFSQEHAVLDADVLDLNQWWKEIREIGRPNFGEMADRLKQFRDDLVRHFRHEESVGLLSLVVELPSSEVENIAALRDEHAKLLAELDQLIACLGASKPEFDSWGSAGDALDAFLKRLDAHEEEEARLIEMAS